MSFHLTNTSTQTVGRQAARSDAVVLTHIFTSETERLLPFCLPTFTLKPHDARRSLSLSLRMHDGLSLTQSLAHTLSPSAIRIRPRLCNHRRHGFCVLHSNSYRLWVLCIEPDIGSMLILILDATSVNLTLALYIFLFVFMYAHSILCSLMFVTLYRNGTHTGINSHTFTRNDAKHRTRVYSSSWLFLFIDERRTCLLQRRHFLNLAIVSLKYL